MTGTDAVNQGDDNSAYKKEHVGSHDVPYRSEIVPERGLVMERIDSPAHRLVEQEVIEVVLATVKIDSCEPDHAECCNYSPGLPAQVPADLTAFLFQKEETDDCKGWHQDADRTFGEKRKEDPDRKQDLMPLPVHCPRA